MAAPHKHKAQQVISQPTENMERVICLLDEYEEWATAGDLNTNHTTLHPLNRMGVIEGIKPHREPWRWRFTPLGRQVLASLGCDDNQNAHRVAKLATDD